VGGQKKHRHISVGLEREETTAAVGIVVMNTKCDSDTL
jgi:hypothetical protein